MITDPEQRLTEVFVRMNFFLFFGELICVSAIYKEMIMSSKVCMTSIRVKSNIQLNVIKNGLEMVF